MKWNINGTKENNIIQCKIIANSISNAKSSNRLTSMTRNDMKLGVNLVGLSKTQEFRGQIGDIPGSHKCYLRTKPLWYEIASKWRLVARPMLRSCKQSSLIVINRTASRESVHQMARPIPSQGRPVSRQTSRATCQSTIMHDWWHDPAWLVARSNTTSYDL